MRRKLGLRLRFALFFAALAAGGSAAFGLGAWLGLTRAGGPADGYIIAWLVGSFALIGLAAWIGLLFDQNVAQPIRGLAADLLTRARADVSVEIDEQPARYLGSIGPAAQSIYRALDAARRSQERTLAEKTATMARDKALFEALVRDLAEGIVVIAPDGQILLYNQVAVEVLGDLGIDRPLGRFIGLDPVLAAAGRVGHGPGAAATGGSAPFLTATPDGATLLSGAVTSFGVGDERLGHVLIFRDATEDLRDHAALDGVLTDILDRARRPAMAIGAVLDVLEQAESMPPADLARFTAALRDEVTRLGEAVQAAERRQSEMSGSRWPMRDLDPAEILDGLRAAHADIFAAPDGEARDLRLHCDGFAITRLWDKLLAALTCDGGRSGYAFGLDPEGDTVNIVLRWDGPAFRQSLLDTILDEPLADAYGPYSGRDALRAHRTDLWIAPGPRLVMPVMAARGASGAPRRDRPDFYDFTRRGAGQGGGLGDIAYVVFDTETTGLDTRTDAVVQIAGVRVLRDRWVRGEVFDSLVAPGRAIPEASSRVHGITDAMVRDAPGFAAVAAGFAAFAEGAVLVAHHAEFDMAFLRRIESEGGPRFPNPVLCTARLSAKLYSHETDHTLDALAERYGITLDEAVRHTALGDAVATAEVFLKMLPVLAEHGIHSLEDALAFQSA